jgi:hypothetical protein
MADRSTILRGFNTHFFDFYDDIIRILPDNKDIAIAKESFLTIKRANATTIIKAWYTYVYSPYSSEIDNSNTSFIVDKDYSNDLAVLKNSSSVMNIIDSIRGPLREMSEINKSHCMKYIQNLSKLSVAYISL